MDQVAPGQGRFVSRPVRIFHEPQRRLFLILSTFPNWPMAIDPIAALRDYRGMLDGALQDVQITDGLYRLGKIGVYQVQISNPVMIDVRLLLLQDGHGPSQVDFLMPRSVYADVLKGVEASIGTIQPL
jgi:hypothetical protein